MGSNKTRKFVPTDTDREAFLKKDLADALKWLVVGAVMWQATEPQENKCDPSPHQRAAVFTSLVQARALYDFYYPKKTHPEDDARSSDFVDGWAPMKQQLLDDYLGPGAPVNKRIFHLAFLRSLHSGGTGENDEDTHLKNQVLLVARKLIEVTRGFVANVRANFGSFAQGALQEALKEAQNKADDYKIASPFQIPEEGQP